MPHTLPRRTTSHPSRITHPPRPPRLARRPLFLLQAHALERVLLVTSAAPVAPAPPPRPTLAALPPVNTGPPRPPSPVHALVVAGGVGANRRLRDQLRAAAAARAASVHYPRPEFCTDNAAMIALAGHARLVAGDRATLAVEAFARWPLAQLTPPAGD